MEKKIKVLLVDDEQEFVETLAERLSMRELTPGVALDGEKALELVTDQVPDVMVLDMKMPGIDGMEVLRRVREAYPQVQVVVLTGHGSEDSRKEAMGMGACDYLHKPVDIDHLVKAIRKAFRRKMENMGAAQAFAEAGDFDTAMGLAKE